MGLIDAEEVPEMVVFQDQGQFEEEFATAPAIGTAVEGETTAVHISDILGQHGTRSGPVDDSWRRVTIVVSRERLLSPEEMDYWNFFAARHEARSGATTFGGMPPFHEATGGRATLDTTVERFDGSRIVNDPPLQVSNVPIDPGEFRGVQLDAEIPGSMTVGQTITFAGTITSSDAADIVEVCVHQVHTGGPVDEEGKRHPGGDHVRRAGRQPLFDVADVRPRHALRTSGGPGDPSGRRGRAPTSRAPSFMTASRWSEHRAVQSLRLFPPTPVWFTRPYSRALVHSLEPGRPVSRPRSRFQCARVRLQQRGDQRAGLDVPDTSGFRDRMRHSGSTLRHDRRQSTRRRFPPQA